MNVSTIDGFTSLGNIILLLGSKCGNQDAIKQQVYNGFLKAWYSHKLIVSAHMGSPWSLGKRTAWDICLQKWEIAILSCKAITEEETSETLAGA